MCVAAALPPECDLDDLDDLDDGTNCEVDPDDHQKIKIITNIMGKISLN